MGRVKEILYGIRDGMAYAFSWLVICTVAISFIGGKEAIPVSFLIKIFVLCHGDLQRHGQCRSVDRFRSNRGFDISDIIACRSFCYETRCRGVYSENT